MSPHDREQRETRSPLDIDDLLASLDTGESEPYDAESVAAGHRIANRLTRRWAHAGSNAGPATVTPIAARRTSVLAVPGWTEQVRAAASGTAGPLQRVVDRELGIEFVRSATDGRETSIVVTSFGELVSAGDVVRVQIGSGSGRTDLLVVLHTADNGDLVGQIITPAVTMSDDLEIALTPLSSLSGEHTRAVTEAVRTSPTPGRNAWRRIAKHLPADHPVRSAIIDGLR
ncbi:hypothetical protein HLB23_11280 [Nocardia uniformis]|uniref:Uncharacterized protein n=1 Tax=Nocardia uniformis TaxID=53432 RepID=A0A849BZ68_9NOCA|nr:hypothetical protein [Nocardia uniformis]NNH70436.1 hypothetical protein [Nocardia uniformis]